MYIIDIAGKEAEFAIRTSTSTGSALTIITASVFRGYESSPCYIAYLSGVNWAMTRRQLYSMGKYRSEPHRECPPPIALLESLSLLEGFWPSNEAYSLLKITSKNAACLVRQIPHHNIPSAISRMETSLDCTSNCSP